MPVCFSFPTDLPQVDMVLVERKLRSLFWFRRPQLLIWISHLNFLQNSLSLTLCIYYLFTYGTGTSILQAGNAILCVGCGEGSSGSAAGSSSDGKRVPCAAASVTLSG